ncbi:hypothetical protein [Amycolatopsis coloradensis]|uniref:hypothetical protein n=1 Tax=Amycolatopsis coloradensis TaxID=76021 RepID=UPI001301732F|nr:hypothetical protein [Amycolatopsis coloradensis]
MSDVLRDAVVTDPRSPVPELSADAAASLLAVLLEAIENEEPAVASARTRT